MDKHDNNCNCELCKTSRTIFSLEAELMHQRKVFIDHAYRAVMAMEAEVARLREAAKQLIQNSWYHHGTKCVEEGDFYTLKAALEEE